MAYIPILTYHRLLKEIPFASVDPKRISVSQAQFRSHLAILAKWGYRSVSLADYPDQLRAGHTPSGKVFGITFDDGYEEVLSLALPVLQEFGFTATVFAVSGQLGGHNKWDHGNAPLLSSAQYRILHDAGLTIGAHTTNHVHLTQVDAGTASREIGNSKRQLENDLGLPVTLFAYPYGESNMSVESQVQQAGFKAAFSTDRAPRDHMLNMYKIRRVVIFPRTTDWNILWKVQSWYPALQDLKR
jgi:peptidoglycan/xylan/chitin deacetylase (PgdA/CDA1 family)